MIESERKNDRRHQGGAQKTRPMHIDQPRMFQTGVLAIHQLLSLCDILNAMNVSLLVSECDERQFSPPFRGAKDHQQSAKATDIACLETCFEEVFHPTIARANDVEADAQVRRVARLWRMIVPKLPHGSGISCAVYRRQGAGAARAIITPERQMKRGAELIRPPR